MSVIQTTGLSHAHANYKVWKLV